MGNLLLRIYCLGKVKFLDFPSVCLSLISQQNKGACLAICVLHILGLPDASDLHRDRVYNVQFKNKKYFQVQVSFN